MPEFKCYFLDFDVEANPDPSIYRDYFINFSPNDWIRGAGDGVFDAKCENGDVATLSLLGGHQNKISIRFNHRLSGERKGVEFYSLARQELINTVKDVGEDQFAPLGSFLEPEIAWQVIEDFFTNPTQKSNKIKWIKSDLIQWPE